MRRRFEYDRVVGRGRGSNLTAAVVGLVIAGSAGDTWAWQTILGNGYAVSVATEASGDVVAGGVLTAVQPQRLLVVKLAAATGAEIWRHGAAPGDPSTFASRVAIDAAGDVVVLVAMEHAAQVRKLDGTSGAVVWTSDVDPTTFGYPVIDLDLALDAAGDVVVAGNLIDGADGGTQPPYIHEALVVKLSGATGDTLWTQQGPLGIAYFGGVDPFGDVWMTRGYTGATTLDKLSGVDGSPSWSVPSPSASTVGAFDADGNAYAHAVGIGVQLGQKIDRNDGAVLWSQPLPSSPGNFRPTARVEGDVVFGSGDGALTRLAGGDGATVWATTLPWSITSSGRMVLTGDGALLVSPGFFPFSTLKLDAETGDLVWYLPVPAPLEDLGYDVADGGDGSAIMVGGGFIVVRMSDRIAGQKISMTDTGTQRLRLAAVDPLVAAPSSAGPVLGPSANPVVVGGDLTISNPLTLETVTLTLVPAGWRASSVKSNGRVTFRYSTPSGTSGPRIGVTLVNGRLLKVRARGALGFSLDEPLQGALAVRVRIGGGVGPRYCVRFDGGTVTSDRPHVGSIKGVFTAQGAAPPATCE